jgi:DNA-binding NtrC family response regulator
MNAKPQVLIVEDDDLQYEIYEDALGHYQLTRAKTGSAALALLPRIQPAALVLDHVLDGGERGLDFLPEFKELLPHVPVIVVSGALEVRQQLAALQGPRRAHYCLPKPVDIRELRRTLETALAECSSAEIIRQFEALERARRIDAPELLSRSTDRLARQNEMLAALGNSRERPNISALARALRVARRTIIRDLQELIRRGQLPAEIYPEWQNAVDEEIDLDHDH